MGKVREGRRDGRRMGRNVGVWRRVERIDEREGVVDCDGEEVRVRVWRRERKEWTREVE